MISLHIIMKYTQTHTHTHTHIHTHTHTGGSPGSNWGLIYPQNGTFGSKTVPDLLKIIPEHVLST